MLSNNYNLIQIYNKKNLSPRKVNIEKMLVHFIFDKKNHINITRGCNNKRD